jgi:hypothetical protein
VVELLISWAARLMVRRPFWAQSGDHCNHARKTGASGIHRTLAAYDRLLRRYALRRDSVNQSVEDQLLGIVAGDGGRTARSRPLAIGASYREQHPPTNYFASSLACFSVVVARYHHGT